MTPPQVMALTYPQLFMLCEGLTDEDDNGDGGNW